MQLDDQSKSAGGVGHYGHGHAAGFRVGCPVFVPGVSVDKRPLNPVSGAQRKSVALPTLQRAVQREDGFYHLLDEDGQPNGPLVYAHISTASDIYGTALINIEDSGNNALTLFTPDGKNRYDYQLMLQGHDLAQQKFQAGASERGGSSKKSTRADDNKDLDPYPQYKDCKGYYDCVDEYGLYPVNEQLKEFLQYFANSQQLFKDGEGWVEINSAGVPQVVLSEHLL